MSLQLFLPRGAVTVKRTRSSSWWQQLCRHSTPVSALTQARDRGRTGSPSLGKEADFCLARLSPTKVINLFSRTLEGRDWARGAMATTAAGWKLPDMTLGHGGKSNPKMVCLPNLNDGQPPGSHPRVSLLLHAGTAVVVSVLFLFFFKNY